MRPWLLAVALQGGLMPLVGGADETARSLVVVVHNDVPAEDVSLSDLRKIFLGERQFWAEDLRVVVLVPPARSAERSVLLEKVYEKNEIQYRQYWISKVFRAETHSAPKSVSSAQVTGDLVRQIPGAISVVSASKVPSGVKILRVDGKSVGDADYALR